MEIRAAAKPNLSAVAPDLVAIVANVLENSLHGAFEEMPDHLRGIGIQSITATADKYSGSCLFSAKDGVFHCVVIMDE